MVTSETFPVLFHQLIPSAPRSSSVHSPPCVYTPSDPVSRVAKQEARFSLHSADFSAYETGEELSEDSKYLLSLCATHKEM